MVEWMIKTKKVPEVSKKYPKKCIKNVSFQKSQISDFAGLDPSNGDSSRLIAATIHLRPAPTTDIQLDVAGQPQFPTSIPWDRAFPIGTSIDGGCPFGSFHPWGYPKMDDLVHGKSHLQMDGLGVPLFQETPMFDDTAIFYCAAPRANASVHRGRL